jgi:hypothetical protein
MKNSDAKRLICAFLNGPALHSNVQHAVPQYRILKQPHTVELGYDVIVETE